MPIERIEKTKPVETSAALHPIRVGESWLELKTGFFLACFINPVCLTLLHGEFALRGCSRLSMDPLNIAPLCIDPLCIAPLVYRQTEQILRADSWGSLSRGNKEKL